LIAIPEVLVNNSVVAVRRGAVDSAVSVHLMGYPVTVEKNGKKQ
jgi:hypothetical protein